MGEKEAMTILKEFKVKLLLVTALCTLIMVSTSCQAWFSGFNRPNSSLEQNAQSLSSEEKVAMMDEYFSYPTFHEVTTLPEYIEQKLPFVPIHSYQKDQTLYFIASAFQNHDKETISALKNNPDIGICSEIWTLELLSENLMKVLVKYEYYPNPLESNPEKKKSQGNFIGVPYGKISAIVDVRSNGDILFDESTPEGMGHYTRVTYNYQRAENKVTIMDYLPGRPEVYSENDMKELKNQTLSYQTLSLFRIVSEIVWKDTNKTMQWSYFTSERLYALRYNIKAPRGKTGKYYHEIGYYDLDNSEYNSLIRKWLQEEDPSPLIQIDLMPDSDDLSLHDWCGFQANSRTNQVYRFDADNHSIQYIQGAENTTEETGLYEVVNQ